MLVKNFNDSVLVMNYFNLFIWKKNLIKSTLLDLDDLMIVNIIITYVLQSS